jgi:hypothetical protein
VKNIKIILARLIKNAKLNRKMTILTHAHLPGLSLAGSKEHMHLFLNILRAESVGPFGASSMHKLLCRYTVENPQLLQNANWVPPHPIVHNLKLLDPFFTETKDENISL